MLYQPDTYKIEQDLSRFGPTGNDTFIPGATEEGLRQYRRLLRNNINNTMVQAFPISRQVLPDEEWNELINLFFANHDAKTTQIWKLPAEFVTFVKENDYATLWSKPWLNDLLYFEWIEIEVYTMPDIEAEPFTLQGEIREGTIVVNPEHRLVLLRYPVHLYAVEEAKNHPGDYFMMVYRHPETREVLFADLTALDTFTFENIAHEQLSLSDIAAGLKLQFALSDQHPLLTNMIAFVQKMMAQKLFLGYAVERKEQF